MSSCGSSSGDSTSRFWGCHQPSAEYHEALCELSSVSLRVGTHKGFLIMAGDRSAGKGATERRRFCPLTSHLSPLPSETKAMPRTSLRSLREVRSPSLSPGGDQSRRHIAAMTDTADGLRCPHPVLAELLWGCVTSATATADSR